MKLDFCDLGRSIAGRPQDPIELRPFEFAFSKEKIVNSCKKLGLSPIHLKTALMHKRVRDDSADGSRATFEGSVRERHTTTLASLGKVGLLSSALEVEAPPPAPAPPTFAMLASPSKAEARWKSLKAAGTCAGAIFHSVGAKAFNAPEITDIALERAMEKKQVEMTLNAQATSDFTLLRTKVEDIMKKREEESEEWVDLPQKDRQDIISYVFKSKGEKGAGKHTGSAAASLAFLDGFAYAEVDKLITDPPCLKGTGRVAKGMSASVIVAELATVPLLTGPALLLTGPEETQWLAFGEVVGVELGDVAPVKLPAWVEGSLTPESQTAAQLVGKEILYKWPPGLGGWARGRVVSMNVDQSKKVGKEVCNYLVFYAVDGDTSEHLFKMCDYARNAKDKTGSWVLLGKED